MLFFIVCLVSLSFFFCYFFEFNFFICDLNMFLFCSYEEKLLGIDIFVCMVDFLLEFFLLMMNMVLLMMVYNYLFEKLSVYFFDDGVLELMFYVFLVVFMFLKYWMFFCKKFVVELSLFMVYFVFSIDLYDLVFV